MTDVYSETQPLTLADSAFSSQRSSPKLRSATLVRVGSQLIDATSYRNFKNITDNIIFSIEECHQLVDEIKEAQKALYEKTAPTTTASNKTRHSRPTLEKNAASVLDRLEYIQQAIVTVEPSKPSLTDLDHRNQAFKAILRSYKDLLERYISITLESQRSASVLFENQIKSVNPHATPFDLERAISSTDDDCPSVFVQILMQRGTRKNDKKTQKIMRTVQDLHQDLRQLGITFNRLSEMRNDTNIVIERYRQRWPVILKEGNSVYVIDDNLNLLEETIVGSTIDFDAILRKREQRNKATLGIIGMVTIFVVVGIIISSAMFSDF